MTADVRTTQRAYPAYKDSKVEWIREIPTHWDLTPVFTVAIQHKVRNTESLESKVLSLSYRNYCAIRA